MTLPDGQNCAHHHIRYTHHERLDTDVNDISKKHTANPRWYMIRRKANFVIRRFPSGTTMPETTLIAFLPMSEAQGHLTLGAMKAVLTDGGEVELGAADRLALESAARHVLYTKRMPELTTLETPSSEVLAQAFPSADYRRYILQLIAIMAFIDGRIDHRKLDIVSRYASGLGITDDYVDDLSETAQDHIGSVRAHMLRDNVKSISGMDVEKDFGAQFLPYDAHPDPALTDRFRALGSLPYETFGRAFYDHYTQSGYEFPGRPGALSSLFAVPHDSTHLLSGYSTSVQGELLVSTFTAAMHRSEGMSGHILPVIFSWHLGIELNPVAGSATGAFDAEKFWRAWERGRMVAVDVFAPDWNFWAVVGTPLAELRSAYHIDNLDEAHAGTGLPAAVRP